MSVSYAANKLRVPPGFEHLLEGLAREILREQPKNLMEFAAQYFRKKLQEREGGVSNQALPTEPVATIAATAEEDTAPSAVVAETQENSTTADEHTTKDEGGEEGSVPSVTEVGEETKIEVEETGAVVESGPSEDVDMEEEGAVQSTANVENEPGQTVGDDNRQEDQEMNIVAAEEPAPVSVSKQNITEESVTEETQKEEGGEGEGEKEDGEGVGEGGEGEERREGEQGGEGVVADEGTEAATTE